MTTMEHRPYCCHLQVCVICLALMWFTVYFQSQPKFSPGEVDVVILFELAEKQVDGLVRSYRIYVAPLGEERTEKEAGRVMKRFSTTSKRAVADAYMALRASKKYD